MDDAPATRQRLGAGRLPHRPAALRRVGSASFLATATGLVPRQASLPLLEMRIGGGILVSTPIDTHGPAQYARPRTTRVWLTAA
jgi:hypothetical protein